MPIEDAPAEFMPSDEKDDSGFTWMGPFEVSARKICGVTLYLYSMAETWSRMPPPFSSRYALSEAVSLEPTLWAMFATMGVVPTTPSSLELAPSVSDESLRSSAAAENIDDMSTLCSEICTG